jgi:hypothetical protein
MVLLVQIPLNQRPNMQLTLYALHFLPEYLGEPALVPVFKWLGFRMVKQHVCIVWLFTNDNLYTATLFRSFLGLLYCICAVALLILLLSCLCC